ncbi:hypothetical protein C8R45DRAFT_1016394 [Mycena sanguinolenta]|nr:hypothetical protein C8R45DRAFT_1016394 [Mycena sanguinolenta]
MLCTCSCFVRTPFIVSPRLRPLTSLRSDLSKFSPLYMRTFTSLSILRSKYALQISCLVLRRCSNTLLEPRSHARPSTRLYNVSPQASPSLFWTSNIRCSAKLATYLSALLDTRHSAPFLVPHLTHAISLLQHIPIYLDPSTRVASRSRLRP